MPIQELDEMEKLIGETADCFEGHDEATVRRGPRPVRNTICQR